MFAYETAFVSEEVPPVVVGAVVVTSVVGSAVVSFVFLSPFPHAASINADKSVLEPNKILLFLMLNLLKVLASQIFYHFLEFI